MDFPSDLRYTEEHEWARADAEGTVTMGITDFAQDALGDIVYLSLPSVGTVVEAGGVLGEVESTKSVSEIYAPVAGEVVAVNEALAEEPEKINTDPYGDGWICRIRPSAADPLASLLDAPAYRSLVET